MDHAAWLEAGASDEDDGAYKYFMRVDPNMREMLGPIEKSYDEVTGREMRSRLAKVTMLRGSKNFHETRVYLDPLPHIRQETAKPLQGWYQPKHNDKQNSRVRPCQTDAILTQPYGGHCNVNCGFCYLIAGGRGYRASSLVTVPINYGAQIRKQLASMKVSQAGYFSSFTDPFLPYEDYYHNTQEAAQAFVDVGLPVFFLSRLAYPGWAFDMLQKNRLSYMQKSINTPHEDDWKKLSPGAISLEEHFEQIREARRKEIYVSIQCNPIVAGIVTNEDIEELIEKLAEAGANHIIFKFVEADFPWAKGMVDKMVKAFGDNRAAGFKELFTENCCGSQRTIVEDYRRAALTRFAAKCERVGITMALCYEYTKKSGQWKSMGPEFLTGDTCHGHRVPFHVRQGDVFKPLATCPPSGCLSCADTTYDGKGKCGSELLGQAKALTLPDLKKPFDGAVAIERGR